jgi:hypothetical protein
MKQRDRVRANAKNERKSMMAQTAVTSTRPALVPPRDANPFSSGEIAANAGGNRGIVAVEAQRAIAEVQARMWIARANPRDPIRAMEKLLNDCTRPTLADHAIYQYARGGTDIRGPSIRLAEAIAQRWGNIASGIKEMSRSGEYSECVAYAWDLESGYYDERQFQVRHWRDTKSGGYQLQDERDIYELIANFGQRRKRAVLLTVIPGDVTEAALEQCERTMQAAADVSPEGVKKLLEAFAEFGVSPAQIEARIQRRLDAVRPAQVVALRKIFTSLRDGMSEPLDWFEIIRPPLAEAAAPAPQQGEVAAAPRRGRGRPRSDAGGKDTNEGDPPPVEAPEPPVEVDPPSEEAPRQDPPASAARRLSFD